MLRFSNDEIQKVRAELLSLVGPGKFNALVRQHSEAVERGKLRFWQIELFEDYIQQSQMSIDALALYSQAFHGAQPVVEPERPFEYPDSP